YGDFWYFWDPKRETFDDDGEYLGRCPMDEARDLVLVRAQLMPINSTGDEASYPDYYKLYGEDEPGMKTVVVTYLVGVDRNFSTTDLGRSSFTKALSILVHGKEAVDLLESDGACASDQIDPEVRPEECEFTASEVQYLEALRPEEDIRFRETRD